MPGHYLLAAPAPNAPACAAPLPRMGRSVSAVWPAPPPAAPAVPTALTAPADVLTALIAEAQAGREAADAAAAAAHTAEAVASCAARRALDLAKELGLAAAPGPGGGHAPGFESLSPPNSGDWPGSWGAPLETDAAGFSWPLPLGCGGEGSEAFVRPAAVLLHQLPGGGAAAAARSRRRASSRPPALRTSRRLALCSSC